MIPTREVKNLIADLPRKAEDVFLLVGGDAEPTANVMYEHVTLPSQRVRRASKTPTGSQTCSRPPLSTMARRSRAEDPQGHYQFTTLS